MSHFRLPEACGEPERRLPAGDTADLANGDLEAASEVRREPRWLETGLFEAVGVVSPASLREAMDEVE